MAEERGESWGDVTVSLELVDEKLDWRSFLGASDGRYDGTEFDRDE